MAISLSGSLLLTGSFTTSGNIVAQTLVVSTISSSVEYSSGSNIFGSSIGNTQTFTGSVNITGSVGINTGVPAYTLDVNGTGRFLNTSDHNLALDSTGRFSSLDFKNNGTLKSQLFWDNTNANLNLTNPSGVGLSIAAGAGAATFASSVSASQFNASSKYAWGTAANGTTGQIATDGTNNYLDYIGNLYFRGAAASNTLITFTSGGAATFTAASTFQGEASNGGTINIGDTAAYRGIITYTGASNTTLSIKNSYDNAGAAINFVLRSAGTPVTALSLLGSGAATFASSVTAASLIKSGGTSSQYLMADGSTSTLSNPVTGTGTTNYVPKFTGTSAIGNSVLLQGSNNTISNVFSSATGTQAFAGMFTGQGGSGYTGTMYFGAGEPNGVDPSYPNIRSGLKVYQSWNGTYTDVKFDLFSLQGGVGTNTVLTGMPNGVAYFPNTVGIGTTTPTTNLEVIGATSNVNGYADGSIQVTGLNPIAFVSPSNLNPSLNRWGFQLRTVNEGDFSIYDYRNSASRMLINSSGNVGIGTTSPQAVLHQAGSRVFTNVGSFYGRQEIMYVQSAYTNPTTNIITVTTGSAYDQTFVKVRVFHNSYSAGYGVESVGYAMQYCNSSGVLQGQTSSSMSVVGQLGGSSNVGTLSWSGTTLQYTPNRITNYDGYAIIVEWSGAPNATYPVLNTAIFD
jgi:hypothetical protein